MGKWLGLSLGLGLFLLLAVVFAVVAVPYVHRFGLGPGAVAGIYGCFLVSLILALLPGLVTFRPWLRSVIWPLPLIWCLPYVLYAAGTGDFRWWALARLLLISVPVVVIYRRIPVRNLARFAWQDLLVAVWLILALMGHQLAGIWTMPANLDFIGRLFLIAVASWSWVFLRPVPELGYELRLTWRVGRVAGLNFLLFAMVAIPAGLARISQSGLQVDLGSKNRRTFPQGKWVLVRKVLIVGLNKWRDCPKRTEKSIFVQPNFDATRGSASPLA
jgi:hypothetical protein